MENSRKLLSSHSLISLSSCDPHTSGNIYELGRERLYPLRSEIEGGAACVGQQGMREEKTVSDFDCLTRTLDNQELLSSTERTGVHILRTDPLSEFIQ